MNTNEKMWKVVDAVREMIMREYPDLYEFNGAEFDVDVNHFMKTGLIAMGYTISSVECFEIQLTLDVARMVMLREIKYEERTISTEIITFFKSYEEVIAYISNFDFDDAIVCDIDLEELEQNVA